MSHSGGSDLLARTRRALLDALEALGAHRDAVVVIGAQAVYLQTGGVAVALAETTKDSDLAVDPRVLGGTPRIEEAMRAAGFVLDRDTGQPGSWVNPDGIPVDLMVPQALSGRGGHRGARVPPHDRRALRRAAGLEAAVVDNRRMPVAALEVSDRRSFTVKIASPAALLVSKLHKLMERESSPDRLADKDAHDVYRLLAGVPVDELVASFRRLRDDSLAGAVTRAALEGFERLFAAGPEALGSIMAGASGERSGRSRDGVGLRCTARGGCTRRSS
ncbi:MAG TPA: GSU2403 family nucleotidyltransferase fold protein [Thermoanaerobaculia bacterium]|nr:GSU2403 family nucleotidyltransferase fold protein [Thermoanaerobaculia bacterium]